MLPIKERKEKNSSVKSVLKAFKIIEELDNCGELSLGELSNRLSMDKATVHRLINTIKEAGYVNQSKEDKKYSNSYKLFVMGNKVVKRTGIKKVARPYLEKLADRAQETVNLGVRADNKIIYIDKIESNSTIKVRLDIGTSVPIYCSGLGKALLAYDSKQEITKYINNTCFEKFTEKSIINKSRFLEELSNVRINGFSFDDEEYVEGLICFGAPIFDFHGSPIAAVSVACPKYRYDESKHLELYSELILETAREISMQLGYRVEE